METQVFREVCFKGKQKHGPTAEAEEALAETTWKEGVQDDGSSLSASI